MQTQQNIQNQAANQNAPRERAVVRRVSVSNATANRPPFITVHFRDAETAQAGYATLPPELAQDPRTTMNLQASMPTLTYPVM